MQRCVNNQLPGWTINDDHTYSMVLWRTINHYLFARIANQRKYGHLIIHDGFMIVGVHDHLSQKRKNQFTEAFQWIAEIYDIFMQFPRRGQNRLRLKCLTSYIIPAELHTNWTLWKWERCLVPLVLWIGIKFCAQRAQVFSHKYAIHLWESYPFMGFYTLDFWESLCKLSQTGFLPIHNCSSLKHVAHNLKSNHGQNIRRKHTR